MVQPWAWQCGWVRACALAWWWENSRWARPRSSGTDAPPSTTGRMWCWQASRRTCPAETSTPVSVHPVLPERPPGVPVLPEPVPPVPALVVWPGWGRAVVSVSVPLVVWVVKPGWSRRVSRSMVTTMLIGVPPVLGSPSTGRCSTSAQNACPRRSAIVRRRPVAGSTGSDHRVRAVGAGAAGVGVGVQRPGEDAGGQVGDLPGQPGPPVPERGQRDPGGLLGPAFLRLQRLGDPLGVGQGRVEGVQDPPAQPPDLLGGERLAVLHEHLFGLGPGVRVHRRWERVEGVGDGGGVVPGDPPGGVGLPGDEVGLGEAGGQGGVGDQPAGGNPGVVGQPGGGGAGAGLGGHVVGTGQHPEFQRGEAFACAGQVDQQRPLHLRWQPVRVHPRVSSSAASMTRTAVSSGWSAYSPVDSFTTITINAATDIHRPPEALIHTTRPTYFRGPPGPAARGPSRVRFAESGWDINDHRWSGVESAPLQVGVGRR